MKNSILENIQIKAPSFIFTGNDLTKLRYNWYKDNNILISSERIITNEKG